MVSPQKIRYNNIFSDTGLGILDIIFDVAFDSDNGAVSSYLNRSAVASESHDGRYKNTHRYKYDELFSPQFTIVKQDFSDFTQDEVRKVLKYLTSTDKPALLEVYYDGARNEVDWACIGGWTSIETYKLANNRTVGIVAQFEAITPFAMSDIYTFTKTPTVTDNKLTIDINTDDNQPVYPRITIQQNSSSSLVEINHAMTDDDKWLEGTVYHYRSGNMHYWLDSEGVKHDSSTNTSGIETTSVVIRNTHMEENGVVTVFDTFVKNNIKGETIVLDGANRIVSSSRTGSRVFGDDFDWKWIPLYDGNNELSFIGNCTVTVEYRTPIKCGEF